MLVVRFFILCSQHLPYFARREGRILYVVVTWYCMSTFYWAIKAIRMRWIICLPPLQPFQLGHASWKFRLWTEQSLMCNHASCSFKFHGETWWAMIFPLTNQFLTKTMMPLLCLTGVTNFLAVRNRTTIARMTMLQMLLFWTCPRKCKSCNQIDMIWTGFLVQRSYI